VRQRGCNGLSYTLDYATEKDKFDVEVVQDGKFYSYVNKYMCFANSNFHYRCKNPN
jgi:Fe-S cluster assembly iron-binding protein IscA